MNAEERTIANKKGLAEKSKTNANIEQNAADQAVINTNPKITYKENVNKKALTAEKYIDIKQQPQSIVINPNNFLKRILLTSPLPISYKPQ